MGLAFTAHKVVKENVTTHTRYITDMPLGGPSHIVLELLQEIFVQTGVVFAGSVEEIILAGATTNPPIKEHEVRGGLIQLEKRGYLWLIGEDMFVPRDKFLGHFS